MKKSEDSYGKPTCFKAIPLASCSNYLNGKTKYNKLGHLGALIDKEDVHVVE